MVHAVADAPAVDIWVNGVAPTAAPLQGLAFKGNTGYLGLAAADYDFVVTPTGAATPEVISASDVPLKAGFASPCLPWASCWIPRVKP